MKKPLFLVVIISIVFGPLLSQAQPLGSEQGSIESLSIKLEQYLSACAALYQFNGSVLVAKRGQILLHKGYGWKNRQANTHNDAQTIFQIGSLTKSLTATLILRLQQEGHLNLCNKLSLYFPAYPQGDQITLEHLLTHSSGIKSYNETKQFLQAAESEAGIPKTKEQILALFQKEPLAFKPGTKYSYSNSGYFLLGWIAEKVTGKPYEHLMREILFEPLEMQDSGFDFIHLQSPHKASGYTSLNEQLQSLATSYDSTISYAAGAMYSTVGDVYNWVRAMKREELLPKKTWQKAFTPFKGEYGYGFFSGKMHKRKFIGHSGGTKGFSSHFVWFPKEDVVIILLSNVLEETILGAITLSLSAILYDQPYQIPKSHQEKKLDIAILKQYVGEYKSKKIPRVTFQIALENGRLVARKKGGKDEILYGETESRFFLKEVDAQVEFIKKGKEGVRVIVYQNGRQYISEKVK